MKCDKQNRREKKRQQQQQQHHISFKYLKKQHVMINLNRFKQSFRVADFLQMHEIDLYILFDAIVLCATKSYSYTFEIQHQ